MPCTFGSWSAWMVTSLSPLAAMADRVTKSTVPPLYPTAPPMLLLDVLPAMDKVAVTRPEAEREIELLASEVYLVPIRPPTELSPEIVKLAVPPLMAALAQTLPPVTLPPLRPTRPPTF